MKECVRVRVSESIPSLLHFSPPFSTPMLCVDRSIASSFLSFAGSVSLIFHLIKPSDSMLHIAHKCWPRHNMQFMEPKDNELI